MNRRSWIGHIAAAVGSLLAGKAFARSNPVHVADTSAPVVASGVFIPMKAIARKNWRGYISPGSGDQAILDVLRMLSAYAVPHAVAIGSQIESASFRINKWRNGHLVDLDVTYADGDGQDRFLQLDNIAEMTTDLSSCAMEQPA